jgi:hypothetical protein
MHAKQRLVCSGLYAWVALKAGRWVHGDCCMLVHALHQTQTGGS